MNSAPPLLPGSPLASLSPPQNQEFPRKSQCVPARSPAHRHLLWVLNKALLPQLVFYLETMCWAGGRRRNKKGSRFWVRQVQCVKLGSGLRWDVEFKIFKKMHFSHVHPNRATRDVDRKYCSWLEKTKRQQLFFQKGSFPPLKYYFIFSAVNSKLLFLYPNEHTTAKITELSYTSRAIQIFNLMYFLSLSSREQWKFEETTDWIFKTDDGGSR